MKEKGEINIINAEEIKKWIPEIAEFLKEADEISIKIEAGIASLPDPKTFWMTTKYNGETTITFNTYHKKRDKTNELPKELVGGENGLKEKS